MQVAYFFLASVQPLAWLHKLRLATKQKPPHIFCENKPCVTDLVPAGAFSPKIKDVFVKTSLVWPISCPQGPFS